MQTIIYSLAKILQADPAKTELTWDIILRDKETYLDQFGSNSTAFSSILTMVIIGCIIICAICIVSFVICVKRARKKGPDEPVQALPLLGAIVCVFIALALLVFKAFMSTGSGIMRSLADGELTVKYATITHKYTDTWTDYDQDGTTTTYTDHILTDDNNNQFVVNKDVYDRAEVGSTYYITQFVNSKNSVNIYNVEEYYYNIQE